MSWENIETARVRMLAYWLWQQRGCPLGTADADWILAERMLGVRPPAAPLPTFALGIELWTG